MLKLSALVRILLQLVLLTCVAEAICCDDIRSDVQNRTLAYNILCSKHDQYLGKICTAIQQDTHNRKLAYQTLCPNHVFDYCKSNPCNSNAICVSNPNSFSCTCKIGFTGSGVECSATRNNSCADIYKSGVRQDGVYTIDPDGLGSFQVRCDMSSHGGGWTVFQKRHDGSVDFYRGWADYKAGFGNLSGEFWLGLDKIYRLSNSGQDVRLRVDLVDFNCSERYVEYERFSVANETDNYRLKVDNYSGDAGDSLASHNQKQFSTKDNDNDIWIPGKHCAVSYKGAWWYHRCFSSNLNALYLGAGSTQDTGMKWYRWQKYVMKKTEMKIRPSRF